MNELQLLRLAQNLVQTHVLSVKIEAEHKGDTFPVASVTFRVALADAVDMNDMTREPGALEQLNSIQPSEFVRVAVPKKPLSKKRIYKEETKPAKRGRGRPRKEAGERLFSSMERFAGLANEPSSAGTSFFKDLAYLCVKKNISVSRLAKELGLASNSVRMQFRSKTSSVAFLNKYLEATNKIIADNASK